MGVFHERSAEERSSPSLPVAILFNLDEKSMAKIENPDSIKLAPKRYECLLASFLKASYGSNVANDSLLTLGYLKKLSKQFLQIHNQRLQEIENSTLTTLPDGL